MLTLLIVARIVTLSLIVCNLSHAWHYLGRNGSNTTTIKVIVRPGDSSRIRDLRWPRQRKSSCGSRPAFGDVPRIAGGYKARLGEFPSYVSLVGQLGSGRFTNCGGTLIHPQIVLTAAHCVDKPANYMVGTGTQAYENWSMDANIQRASASHRCVSSRFNMPTNAFYSRFDYAVLVLSKPIQFNNLVQPACLPDKPLREGESGVTAGTGLVGPFEQRATSLKALPVIHTKWCPQAAKEFACFKSNNQRLAGSSCPGECSIPYETFCTNLS